MSKPNKNSTRYYSDLHEKSICKALGATQQSNSGAGNFRKGDCVRREASLLIEAKTSMTEKSSISIKKEWIDKNKEEGFSQRLENQAICFNYGPNTSNFYIINETLMKFLVEKLDEQY